SEYARMPPLYALDEHEPCVSRERGLYCLLRLELFHDGDNPLMDLIKANNNIKHYNHSIIERGVCVQEACAKFIDESSQRGEALTRALGACLNESIWQEYGLQANVSLLYYCDSNGESDDISTLDWTILAVFITIVVGNLVASFYDYVTNYCNEKEHVAGKVLTNCLMILAHAMLTVACGYTINTHDFEKTYELVSYQLIYNGMMIVQIFFFISGFLLVYNFQIYADRIKITWFDIPKVMILRYCRLSPALAVVLAFTATWLRHLGSGPLWKLFVTNSVVADCRTYWWHHLLYINNYMQEDKYCAIPTWHIAADTQIYLIGLIACVATIYRRRHLTLTVLLIVATVIPMIQVWLQDLDGVVVMTPE
ncbi:Acyltransferase OPGC1, partial [Operophtera brumata]